MSELTRLAQRPEWWKDAACKGARLELFYDKWSQKAALSICADCRVKRQCLADTLELERTVAVAHIEGVRGGTTPAQRRRMRGWRRKKVA